MKANKEKIHSLFKQIYGLKSRNVKQGHGSFVTMDFGDKDIFPTIKTNKGIKKLKRGEWYFWITSSWHLTLFNCRIHVVSTKDDYSRFGCNRRYS